MQIQPVTTFSDSLLDKLLTAISFYQQVKQKDPYQYELLLLHSRLEEFDAGDRVICQGNKDSWLYFLLKGQLEVVRTNREGQFSQVNHITPGEVFGGLSTLLGVPRTASIYVEDNAKGALIFGTDFSIFGELDDTSIISLSTKLLYYQNLVHSLRWQLESYRNRFPNHPLADSHRKIKLFIGRKGSLDELRGLDTQGRALAQLVISWNKTLLNSEFEHASSENKVYL